MVRVPLTIHFSFTKKITEKENFLKIIVLSRKGLGGRSAFCNRPIHFRSIDRKFSILAKEINLLWLLQVVTGLNLA